MKLVRILTVALLVAAFAACFPRPAFMKAFKDYYHPKGALSKATCVICHVAKSKITACQGGVTAKPVFPL